MVHIPWLWLDLSQAMVSISPHSALLLVKESWDAGLYESVKRVLRVFMGATIRMEGISIARSTSASR